MLNNPQICADHLATELFFFDPKFVFFSPSPGYESDD